MLVGREPRQPRLHAVETEALGQALPGLSAPRLGVAQRRGPLPDLGRGQQLPAPEDHDLVEVGHRTLVSDRELGQPVDLVAPQVDAHRRKRRRWEDVDDRAAYGHLTPVLDLVLPAVAEMSQLLHQFVQVDLRPPGDLQRLGVLDMGRRAAGGAP